MESEDHRIQRVPKTALVEQERYTVEDMGRAEFSRIMRKMRLITVPVQLAK